MHRRWWFFAVWLGIVVAIIAMADTGHLRWITDTLKNYPNSFRDTKLKQMLDAQGVKDLVIIGAMSHMCVEATSRAAADLGYPVSVVHDACATMNLEFGGAHVPAAQVHATAMAALGFAYASLTTTDAHLA